MMLRVFLLGVLLCTTVSSAMDAESIDKEFQNGIELYSQGSYEAALERFSSILPQAPHWRVHYNIGNCHFRLERYLEAKTAWARAWKAVPGQKDVLRNIKVVNTVLGFEDELLKPDLVSRFFAYLDRLTPPRVSSGVLLVSLLLFNLSAVMWMRRKYIRPARYVFLISLLLSLLFLSHVMNLRHRQIRTDLAIVSADQVSVFSGPGAHHTALFSLPKGLIVMIRETGGAWIRVTAGADVSGWMRPEWLTVL